MWRLLDHRSCLLNWGAEQGTEAGREESGQQHGGSWSVTLGGGLLSEEASLTEGIGIQEPKLWVSCIALFFANDKWIIITCLNERYTLRYEPRRYFDHHCMLLDPYYIECGEICTCVEGLIYVGNFAVGIFLLQVNRMPSFGNVGLWRSGSSVRAWMWCTEHIPVTGADCIYVMLKFAL